MQFTLEDLDAAARLVYRQMDPTPQPRELAALDRSTTPATTVVPADQTTQAALQVDRVALAPQTGFLNRLRWAGQTVTRWWQEQWQKVLRKS